jgi:uncharacterized protein YeaO (DUF488 family)
MLRNTVSCRHIEKYSITAWNRMMIKTKRIYEPPHASDGFRVLVDRLWPRGLSKSKAHVDLWMKEIAPSTALRGWFAHDRTKWEEFTNRYREELAFKQELVADLLKQAEKGDVTLLYAAQDEMCNNAVVLLDHLKEQRHR